MEERKSIFQFLNEHLSQQTDHLTLYTKKKRKKKKKNGKILLRVKKKRDIHNLTRNTQSSMNCRFRFTCNRPKSRASNFLAICNVQAVEITESPQVCHPFSIYRALTSKINLINAVFENPDQFCIDSTSMRKMQYTKTTNYRSFKCQM